MLEEFLIEFYKLQEKYNVQLYASKDDLVLDNSDTAESVASDIACFFNHQEVVYLDNTGNQIILRIEDENY